MTDGLFAPKSYPSVAMDEVYALRAENERLKAQVAMAYEAAAVLAENANDDIWDIVTGEKFSQDATAQEIRNLTRDDARVALEARDKRVRAEALRELKEMADLISETKPGSAIALYGEGYSDGAKKISHAISSMLLTEGAVR